jgi:hypothetical protein
MSDGNLSSPACAADRPQLKERREMNGWARYLPILDWGRHYGKETLSSDLLAAVIVTIMLVPQSLAYAMLAGLPAGGRALRLDPPPGRLRDLRHEPHARRRSCRGRLADDRLGDRGSGGPGHADYLTAADRARISCRVDAGADGAVAARLRRELPKPSGDFRLHHGRRPADRGRSVAPHTLGVQRRQRPLARNRRRAGWQYRRDQPVHPGNRRIGVLAFSISPGYG